MLGQLGIQIFLKRFLVMTELTPTEAWLSRGIQRRAVAGAIDGIMSATQIWRAARAMAPRMQLRDLRAILREYEARGIVDCLTPQAPCGRLFSLTPLGRAMLARLLPGRRFDPPNHGLPSLELLSFLVRARVRRAVFFALAQPELGKAPTTAASTIKRRLRTSCPITLTQAIRALHQLEKAGLVESCESEGRLHRYALSDGGQSLYRWLSDQQSQNTPREFSRFGIEAVDVTVSGQSDQSPC